MSSKDSANWLKTYINSMLTKKINEEKNYKMINSKKRMMILEQKMFEYAANIEINRWR